MPQLLDWQCGWPSITALKKLLAKVLRRLAARNGFVVLRVDRGLPEDLESYVKSVLRRGTGVERVFVLDADPEPLRTFFNLFKDGSVACYSDPNLRGLKQRLGQSDFAILEIDAAVRDAT